jgi:hypothetical protein
MPLTDNIITHLYIPDYGKYTYSEIKEIRLFKPGIVCVCFMQDPKAWYDLNWVISKQEEWRKKNVGTTSN